jgi:exodeoxyribonuclease-3
LSILKIATWNVNSLNVRQPQVIDFLSVHSPSVLCLQETKLTDDKFPLAVFEEMGYHCAFAGQKTYNGVAIFSKTPLSDVVVNIPEFQDEQVRVISATIEECRIINVYVPNGAAVGTDKYAYKLKWLAALKDYLAKALLSYPKLCVMGDFNIAPTDIDVYDPIAWQGAILCSPPEREAFDELISLGLIDTFRCVNSEAGQYSWWDYRQGGFRRNHGLRIDHILASPALILQDSYIDKTPRSHERPSDHTPVISQFKL